MANRLQPKKRLIICCDGTWNSSVSTDSPLTNVSRLSRCIEDVAPDGVAQIVYYHTGIGSGTWKHINAVDASIGIGLEFIVRNVYSFICLNVGNPEDEIYLVGFSRGAYTVRCILALVNDIGLLTKEDLVHLHALYENWTNLNGSSKTADAGRKAWFESFLTVLENRELLRRPISIEACAVWDTVAAIGLPLPLPLPSITHNALEFVEASIPHTLNNVFHALALNEERKNFKPLLWVNPPEKTTLRQC
ncbi:uncharacterized protein BDZ99DRAFT_291009 [Mytilinidion resinicola]|uniref:T6SS Phospholipase effector Tle1-like catalytic domain-containing protein n=1 Tax=Mytilinidion resinicola TaxID=574789 RepID=A0A6A6YSM5_9PEZI|nr:uncharacterized protein BDZ99DRAFT_291009 [Mytilinidion resinicola]KAF2810917.1 hypothetical protein BDZ99DRAFT_291009 [Mytilinidion resinicola]